VPFLPSLPAASTLLAVLGRSPAAAAALLDYHEAVMRGDSPLSAAEREMIAAYVSGLNACGYCHGVHEATAQAFGLPAGVLDALLVDVDAAPVDARLKPLLRYARRLTLEPARTTQRDVDAILDKGWSEQAVLDTAAVCGLFSLMNRLVEGAGIAAPSDYTSMAGQRLREGGYTALKDLLPQPPK
jgi:uncharacterized peroxidase-related enzyme